MRMLLSRQQWVLRTAFCVIASTGKRFRLLASLALDVLSAIADGCL